MGFGDNKTCKIDLTQPSKTIVPVTSFWAPGYYFSPCYVAAKDMLITAWCDYGTTRVKMNGYDLASGTPVEFAITQGSAVDVIRDVLSLEWCPDTGKFYGYEGYGSNKLYVLTPPADWKSGTWTWGTETMGGETPVDINVMFPGGTGGQPLTKWRYNPALKCFMWSQGTTVRTSPDGVARAGAFQLYRPLGT
jgi:hypothetical protein